MTMAGGAAIMATSMSGFEAAAFGAAEAASKGAKAYVATHSSAQPTAQTAAVLSSGDQELMEIAASTENNLDSLLRHFEGDTKVDWKELEVNKVLEAFQAQVKRQKEKVKECKKDANTKANLANKVETLLNDFKELLDDFQKQAKEEPENVIDLHEKLEGLLSTASEKLDAMRVAVNMPVTNKVTPGAIKSMLSASDKGTATSLTESRLKMAHTKLEMMREQAKQTQQQADVARERQLESNRKMKETMEKLQKFKAEENTQKAVLEILVEGIKQFAQLKTQWTKLLLFFTEMSNLVKVTMGSPLNNFVAHSKAIQDDMLGGHGVSRQARDQIYTPSYEAVKIAYLVNNLATAYMEISTEHMMPQVAKLSELLALSSSSDKKDIEAKKLEVNKEAQVMQEKIETVLSQRTNKFKRDVEARMIEIETTFNSIIPAISTEEKKAVVDKVQKDIREAEKDFAELTMETKEVPEASDFL